jgi:hypothetical protein
MVLRESIDRKDFSQLRDIHNFLLFQLKISVECTIVELSEISHGVSSREIFLLLIVDCDIHINFWLSIGFHWVWNLLEVFVVRGAVQIVNHIFELLSVVKRLGSVWVKMSKVVEVLLSEALTFSIAHFRFVERVVDNLKSFPVTFSLQYFVHLLFSASVALGHYPSVELNKPNLFKENFDVA